MCKPSTASELRGLLTALAGSPSRAVAEKLVLGAGAVYVSLTFPFQLVLSALQGQVVTSFTEDEIDRKGRSLTAQGPNADPKQSYKRGSLAWIQLPFLPPEELLFPEGFSKSLLHRVLH